MQFKLKSLSKVMLGIAVAGFATSAVASTTLKLSHNHNRSHPVNQALKFMADRAKELSGGELKIRIYPDSQLGSQRESLELVQKGALAMAKSNAAELEVFSKDYGVYNMPYLFTDREQYYKVMMGEIGEKILESSKAQGFIGLAYFDGGSRSFYAQKPINSPADLVGLKVRVQPSPSAVSMVEYLGGSPTPLAFGELYTALQQNVVDAAENNIPSYTLTRHSEVAKFFSEDEHAMIPDILVVSTKVWDKLDEKEQKALKQAATEATMKMKDLWTKSEDVERKKAIKQGVTFVKVDKAPFKAAVEPMYADLQKNNPEMYSVVEKIRKIK